MNMIIAMMAKTFTNDSDDNARSFVYLFARRVTMIFVYGGFGP